MLEMKSTISMELDSCLERQIKKQHNKLQYPLFFLTTQNLEYKNRIHRKLLNVLVNLLPMAGQFRISKLSKQKIFQLACVICQTLD